jgi:hybrid cluster-associated redox disulfide protein
MLPETTVQLITLDTYLADIVTTWPQTIGVFNAYQMACPGCHISPFHTVADGAREYGLQASELLQALNEALRP